MRAFLTQQHQSQRGCKRRAKGKLPFICAICSISNTKGVPNPRYFGDGRSAADSFERTKRRRNTQHARRRLNLLETSSLPPTAAGLSGIQRFYPPPWITIGLRYRHHPVLHIMNRETICERARCVPPECVSHGKLHKYQSSSVVQRCGWGFLSSQSNGRLHPRVVFQP